MIEEEILSPGFTAVAETYPLRLHPPLVQRHRMASTYRPALGLREAANVAMLLGSPLLLTGDPGVGKTQAAYWLAAELGLDEPLRFDVKSNTTGTDLLYRFDDVRRFRDATLGGQQPLVTYLRLNALGEALVRAAGGRAILRSLDGQMLVDDNLGRHAEMLRQAFGEESLASAPYPTMSMLLSGDERFRTAEPEHHLVLIDELDKAPRDTPNDLLAEVEELRFAIPELGVSVVVEGAGRPIIIITSNSEKSLPEPFLRRCAFFDIPYPDSELELQAIVDGAIDDLSGGEPLVRDAIAFVRQLRADEGIRKPPGIAELLAWLNVLVASQGDARLLTLSDIVYENRPSALSALLKSPADHNAGQTLLTRWSVEHP